MAAEFLITAHHCLGLTSRGSLESTYCAHALHTHRHTHTHPEGERRPLRPPCPPAVDAEGEQPHHVSRAPAGSLAASLTGSHSTSLTRPVYRAARRGPDRVEDYHSAFSTRPQGVLVTEKKAWRFLRTDGTRWAAVAAPRVQAGSCCSKARLMCLQAD